MKQRTGAWVFSGVAALAVIGIGIFGAQQVRAEQERSIATYTVIFERPTGWTEGKADPRQIFNFYHENSNSTIVGYAQNVYSDVNPTPELDAEAHAMRLYYNTIDGMPGWEAEYVGLHKGANSGETFAIVDRRMANRRVVTAFVAKGNTTLLFSLGAWDQPLDRLDEVYPEFIGFLDSLDFEEMMGGVQLSARRTDV